MRRIIAVDLDGTLLSSKNTITEYTKEIIQLLAKKNIFFILASGRHHVDIIEIRDILKIRSFIIASNGAKIYDLDNQLIFSDCLDKEIASQLCKIKYLEKDIITQVYKKNRWFVNNNKVNNKFCSALSSLQYEYFTPDKFAFDNICKIFFTSNNFEKLYILEKKIIDIWGEKVNISFSVPGCLEVVSGKTSKGHGVRLISHLLGIPLDSCIAFGDGMNDLDMLTISGQAYIMKNADSCLKNALPNIEIIDSNNNNGVAKRLDEIFIKHKKI
ncbi:Cof-type HAD-IIB family hydrolase [Buchnera aphidicola (Hyperomyzus lactucae)]|uniref:Cof-type HAD-IIB family hydrolase n=1 Tax=Buchnera aphidicola (Hyperomyzus lactucae) TaxID=1241860 RepID=A0A4D6XXY1_9GAMM|nr:Cof-type HAD-IIB family hydrolase [Buchnera aphidicola]QCI20779.1 Cof-type HAD-IIB family hydrolase [Buchnera aphidicola (Hyperomyzus lactucae)]